MLKLIPWPIARLLVVTGLYRLMFRCYRRRYTERTLQEVLDELTDNGELRLVLSYICGDYGVFPNEVPFLLHALVVKHYVGGAWYPRGGTSEIAFHMVQAIQHHGGRVLVQAPVTNIICDDKGRAVGVKVAKLDTEIQAKIVISDAGLVNTFKTLLPPLVAQASYIYPLIQKVGPSCSFITTFIGVDGSPNELKLPAGNTWLYNCQDINKTMRSFLESKAEDIEDLEIPFGYISFPSAKDAEWDSKYPGKSSVLVITLAKWEWFKEWKNEKLRHCGDRYENIKDVIGRKMWQQCVDLFPQLDGRFYEELEEAKTQCSQQNPLIIMGDFNARKYAREENIVGPHGLGTRNLRGEKLVEWCKMNNLIIGNTWFQQPPRRKWTWKSPGEEIRNQIDFILLSHRFRNALLSA
ncbi:all-trans-retinol 13,14-reductase [Plakobranchus ocellatus]|uniref:All-trans-retinol 13,14-reductase n=1 Tax=Plakobranchus ocellatus TaxID=259542 RepID=A0AAV4B4X1_9GAST|nr:all-trans-retinol 13,14-reductase [Plakobranchus ocellatus]